MKGKKKLSAYWQTMTNLATLSVCFVPGRETYLQAMNFARPSASPTVRARELAMKGNVPFLYSMPAALTSSSVIPTEATCENARRNLSGMSHGYPMVCEQVQVGVIRHRLVVCSCEPSYRLSCFRQGFVLQARASRVSCFRQDTREQQFTSGWV